MMDLKEVSKVARDELFDDFDGFDAELSKVILVSSHPEVVGCCRVEVVRPNQVQEYIAALRAELVAKLQSTA